MTFHHHTINAKNNQHAKTGTSKQKTKNKTKLSGGDGSGEHNVDKIKTNPKENWNFFIFPKMLISSRQLNKQSKAMSSRKKEKNLQ